ncbi:MAG: HEPN domain-containing protein [Tannerella sp.]|jgi:uncharacterized protein (UPF0332 family)|nr:HEPN domain-containing protein [Tannerella sp.]
MGLTEIEKKALIDLKIERANETIKEVPYLVEQGFYRTAINRMYYACYYVVSALLMKHNFEARTHKGVITLFSLNFIKTGIVDEITGKLYRSVFELRQSGDYDELKDITKEDVTSRLEPAIQFIKTIENLIYRV